MQLDYGIEVKWLTRKDSLRYASLERFIHLIGTFDFAIVNEKYLLEFFEKGDKTLISLQCTSEERLVQEISTLYGWLWDESRMAEELLNL